MIEVEEVYLNDNEQYEQTEFLVTDEDPKATPAQVSKSLKTAAMTTLTTGNKRKVPLVRLPGEVVTPVKLRSVGTVSVAESLPPLEMSHVKIDWAPKNPLVVKTALKRPLNKPEHPLPSSSKIVRTSDHDRLAKRVDNNYDDDDDDDDDEDDDIPDATAQEVQNSGSGSSDDRLARIESKLDLILTKLSQHDAALKLLKFNIKDLRIELKNSHKPTVESDSNYSLKREKKRIVLFPVADDNYLYRLDEMCQTDEDIRDEVVLLFNEAPTKSVYDFLRRNVVQLFENCSKHTWTGKVPHNATSDQPAANPACKMHLLEMLITCCSDKFPNATRDYVDKECRRALSNFNEARQCRLMRRMQKDMAEGAVDESATGN